MNFIMFPNNEGKNLIEHAIYEMIKERDAANKMAMAIT